MKVNQLLFSSKYILHSVIGGFTSEFLMKHCLYSRLSVLQDNKGENSRRQVLKFKVSGMVVTRGYSNEEEMLSLWQITQLMWLKNVIVCFHEAGISLQVSQAAGECVIWSSYHHFIDYQIWESQAKT